MEIDPYFNDFLSAFIYLFISSFLNSCFLKILKERFTILVNLLWKTYSELTAVVTDEA